MTLREILECLLNPDHLDDEDELLDLEVRFDTSDRQDLELFSVYYDSGILRVDVGDEGDD